MGKQTKRQPEQNREPVVTAAETTTIEVAAKRLRIGRNQAYEAAQRGELPAFKMGRRWLVVTAALNRMLSGENVKQNSVT
jgi:excisionase family DNA binding protein